MTHINRELTFSDKLLIVTLFVINTYFILGAMKEVKDPCQDIGMEKLNVVFDRFDKTVEYQCKEKTDE